MKTTIEDRGHVVYVRREIFAEGQSDEEEERDYRLLLDSMRGCRMGNCERCMFCNYQSDSGEFCTDALLRVAENRIRKLRGL